MNDQPIFYKRVDSHLIAFIKTRVDNREQILPILESLRSACGEFICGDAMVIFHGGAVKDGFLLEAAFPVSQSGGNRLHQYSNIGGCPGVEHLASRASSDYP